MDGAEGLAECVLQSSEVKNGGGQVEIKDTGLSSHGQNQVFSFSAAQASGGLLINEFAC